MPDNLPTNLTSDPVHVRLCDEDRARLDRIASLLEVISNQRPAAPAPARAPAKFRTGQATSGGGNLPTTFPAFGKRGGAPIRGADASDLQFYRKTAEKSLNDPARARWADNNRALISAIDAELNSLGNGGGYGADPMAGGGSGRNTRPEEDEPLPFVSNMPVPGIP